LESEATVTVLQVNGNHWIALVLFGQTFSGVLYDPKSEENSYLDKITNNLR